MISLSAEHGPARRSARLIALGLAAFAIATLAGSGVARASVLALAEDTEVPPPAVSEPSPPPPGCSQTTVETQDEAGTTIQQRTDCGPPPADELLPSPDEPLAPSPQD